MLPARAIGKISGAFACGARPSLQHASDLLGTHAFEQIAPELEADFNALDELLRALLRWANSRRGLPTLSPASASAFPQRSRGGIFPAPY